MKKTKTISLCALFAVIIAIMSWISIPTPLGVPVTLQLFAVSLCGFMLGTRRGTVTVALYILLGAVGLPVFSSMQGGFGVLLSATGGFIWGFVPLSFFCGTAKKGFCFLGLAFCYIIGILQLSLVGGGGILSAALTSLPFLIKDTLLVVAAKQISKRINLEDIYD